MSPELCLRKSLAYVLICSLSLAGLIGITIRQSYASNTSLPSFMAPSVNESLEETAPQAETVDEATRSRVTEAFGKLPLSFEENRGQVDKEVKYFSHGSGYTLFLTPSEAVLALRRRDGKKETITATSARRPSVPAQPRPAFTSVVRMRLSGANQSPAVIGEDETSTKTNYFKGNDPQKWHTDVARYERVRYRQVYPGIDMIYYGKQQSLEYDLEVAPGADARQIALEFTGVKRVQIERGTGDLVLKTAGGEVRQHRPVAYQETGGERREVASRYVMQGKQKVGIEVGEYDRTQRLVVDPVLSYSTYLGGNDFDEGNGIAVDSSGNVYVTGETASTDFPTLNSYQAFQGYQDVFVMKLDANACGAASLLYSTVLGGSSLEGGIGIAVDSSGNIYVAGTTYSSDFPTVNQYQTYQGGPYGESDAFVVKLNPNLSGTDQLLYSTYLGGNSQDYGYALAIDLSGNAYVTGGVASADFPVKNQYQSYPEVDHGDIQYLYQAYVTKLNPNLSGAASLLYSSYLGGDNGSFGTAIAVDSSGMTYVTGETASTDFPTLNPYSTSQGQNDVNAFVTKIGTELSGAASLLYSTYLGGSFYDGGYGIVADSSGNIYVTGWTQSADFPTLHQYQSDQVGDDAFVTKLNPNLSGTDQLLYSTYLGGSGNEFVFGSCIALDSSGNVYVTGSTDSTNFPTKNQYQSHRGHVDSYITKLDTNLSGAASLLYSTYLGGSLDERTYGIAADSSGNAYVTGYTLSTNFPTFHQYQARHPYYEAFVTKLGEPSPTVTISGHVTLGTATGEGLAGVTLTLTGGACFTPRAVNTASDGTYSFIDVPTPANYTITTSKHGYSFRPVKIVINNVTGNRPNKNFVATRTYTISGVVKLGPAGLSGVTVKLTSPTPAGFAPRTATTDSNGAYSFTNVPAGRNYTVTPQKIGYRFTQTSRSFPNLSANHYAVNFFVEVYSISGRITRTGTTTGIRAVTVTLASPTPAGFPTRSALTTNLGDYKFMYLPAGRNYTIKPTKSGYRLSPTTRSIANLSDNIPIGASTNFTGTGP